jgi:hypothetical protein
VMIYDLMMSNAIEEKGFWRHNGKPLATADAFKTLVDRVGGTTKHQPADISSSLAYAVEQGNLRCAESQGQVEWKWVDYL